jgi:hypothetical protein
MKSKLFRRPTALSPEGHLSILSRGAASGRAAALSALLLLFALPAAAQYNLTLCEGQGFMLTSDADGPDELGQLTYTWKEGVPPQAPGTVTAVPTLTVTGKPAGTYAYLCEVANAACALQSSSYTVEVAATPGITTQPTASSAICAGGTVSLSVVASGATAYQWKKNGVNVTDGSGGTTTNYTTAALTANATYTVEVGNGSCSVTSSEALVQVYAMPAISTQPASTSVCSGRSVQLKVVASNATAYQWKKGSANVTDGSGGTTTNYTTATLSANATYSVVVSNGLAACSVTSNNALVTITAPPTITTQPAASRAVCAGGVVSLSVTASGATAHQWKKNGANVTDGSGSTTANYTTAALNANATYTVVVSNGSCSVTSNNTLVTVVQTPTTPTVTSSASSVCAGTAITYTASGGSGTYVWSCTGTNFTCTGNGNRMYTPTAAGTYTAKAYAVATLLDASCTSGYSYDVTVTVRSPGAKGEPATCGCIYDNCDNNGTCDYIYKYCSNLTAYCDAIGMHGAVIMLQDYAGFCWPSAGGNTSAYVYGWGGCPWETIVISQDNGYPTDPRYDNAQMYTRCRM